MGALAPPFAAMCSVASGPPLPVFYIESVTLQTMGDDTLNWVVEFNKPLDIEISTGDDFSFFCDAVPCEYVISFITEEFPNMISNITSWSFPGAAEYTLSYPLGGNSIFSADGDPLPETTITFPNPF